MKSNYYPASGGYKRIILLPFLLLITLGFLLAWTLYLAGSRQAVHGLIETLSVNTAKKAEADLYAFLDQARQTALLNGSYLEQIAAEGGEGFTLPRVFREQLKSVPVLEIVSVGFGDGEYREAQRLETGELRFGISGKETGGALSFYEVYPNKVPPNMEEPGAEEPKLVDALPDYDPRKRPWYISARKESGPSWSSIYKLYSNSDLAISSAVPFRNRDGREGVITACLVLSHLSTFLGASLDPSIGSVVVMDEQYRMVASNRGFNTVIDIEGNQLFWEEEKEKEQGRNRFGTEVAINSELYPPWTIIVRIEESAFTEPLIRADRLTALILATLLLLIFLIGWVIVNNVTEPIRDLQEAVRTLSPSETHQNTILPRLAKYKNEIGSLADSFLKMNLRITEDYNTLRKNLDEKELLLKEIHHRVKNNLQIVSSMLSLESFAVSDPQDRKSLESCQDRIQAMAYVHENAYSTGRFTEVDMEIYLNRVCTSLLSARPGIGITVTTRPKQLFLPLDIAIPSGLIVNELVTNCIKYAFDPGYHEAEVVVQLTRNEEGYQLSVSDNGKGKSPQKDRDNLGSDLIEALSTQIGGKLAYSYKEGTRAVIEIPLDAFTSTHTPS